jgi:hypothetical protein
MSLSINSAPHLGVLVAMIPLASRTKPLKRKQRGQEVVEPDQQFAAFHHPDAAPDCYRCQEG